MTRAIWIVALTVAAAAFVVDLGSKQLILWSFAGGPGAIEIAPFFNLVLTLNRGISFGLFNQGSDVGPYVFLALSLAIVGGLLIWLRRIDRMWIAAAVGLIIGGALGNALDRLRHGGVVDFLDFHALSYHWPAFNLADTAIVIGVSFLLLEGMVVRRPSVLG